MYVLTSLFASLTSYRAQTRRLALNCCRTSRPLFWSRRTSQLTAVAGPGELINNGAGGVSVLFYCLTTQSMQKTHARNLYNLIIADKPMSRRVRQSCVAVHPLYLPTRLAKHLFWCLIPGRNLAGERTYFICVFIYNLTKSIISIISIGRCMN